MKTNTIHALLIFIAAAACNADAIDLAMTNSPDPLEPPVGVAGGPFGGAAYIVSASEDRVVVGHSSGFYSSTNAGRSFERLPVFQVQSTADFNGTLWAATQSGLFSSSDNGQTFIERRNGGYWFDLDVDEHLLVGSRGPSWDISEATLQVSNDGGATFVDTGTRARWTTLDHGRLFIANEGGLSFSDDDGQSFTPSTGVDAFNTAFGIVRSDGRLFAQTIGASNTSIVFSDDHGATFQAFAETSLTYGGATTTDQRLITLGSAGHILNIDLGTATHSELKKPAPPPGFFQSVAFSQGRLFVAHRDEGLWHGALGDEQMTVARLGPDRIWSIRTDGERLYALGRLHIHVSWDNGQTWVSDFSTVTPFVRAGRTAVGISRHGVFAASERQLLHTIDGGQSWMELGRVPIDEPFRIVRAASGRLVVATRKSSNWPGNETNAGVLVSDDNGARWRDLSDRVPLLRETSNAQILDLKRSENGRLIVTVSDASEVYAFYSDSEGGSWTEAAFPAGIGRPEEWPVQIAVAQDSVYLQLGSRLFKSIDGGATFAARSRPPTLTPTVLDATEGAVAALDSSGQIWLAEGNDDFAPVDCGPTCFATAMLLTPSTLFIARRGSSILALPR